MNAEIVHRLNWTLDGGRSGFDLQTPSFARSLISGDLDIDAHESIPADISSDEADLIAMYRNMGREAQEALYRAADALSDKASEIGGEIAASVDVWREDKDLSRAEAIRRLIKAGLESTPQEEGATKD